MVAILEKSDAAQGFEQISDFLSGSYIHHALTVNPHVYISCIKQFWNTAVVKRSGDITRLQALVDKKRIVISEEVVREILQLNDAEGVVCLPNKEIFAGLAHMGYEKPSAMASALICLSSGQRFNFSKYIFESLVHNVDSTSKFYMYPRVGKGFLGVETPIFETMLRAVDAEEEVHVLAQDDVVQEDVIEEITTEVVPPTPTSPSPPSPVIPSSPPYQSPCPPQPQAAKENANAAQQLEILTLKARVKKLERLNKVKSSKLRCLKKVGTSQRVESSEDVENVFNQRRISVDMETDEGIELEVDQEKCAEVEGRQADTQAEIYNIDLDHSSKVLSMQKDTEVQEAVEVVTTAKIITEVVTDAATQVAAASTPIPAAKPKVFRIAAAAPAVSIKRRKGKDQIEMDAEYAKKLQEELEKEHEEAYKQIDWNAAFDHVQAKRLSFKMEFFKGKTYDQILLIFQARFDANLKFLFKTREEMEKEDEEIIKSINETPAQKEAKRRKLSEEAQEADNLRGRLEIVQDEDDDVFVEAIPLGQKVPVVDYQVVVIDNKPRYKIIRADDTHQLYISFTTLLKNFDREDLETL
nr:hypothetical protein [Tanacetum cinerariifolium]